MEVYDFTAKVNKIISENPVHTLKPTLKCSICNDEGRIQYFKIFYGMKYETYCHCTCEIGKTFIYEGHLHKDKSNYRMASIEEILPPKAIEELKETNKTTRHRIHEQRKKSLLKDPTPAHNH
jgi:hypothetical protein